MNKINGQIWIEKGAPYKLKYHVANKDFSVETSEEYKISSGLVVGDLVKIGSNGALVKAEFPDDLRNVIGMLVSNTGAVSKIGYVNIPLSKIEKNVAIGDSLYWLDKDTYSYSIVKDTKVKYHNLPLIGTVVGISDNIASIHLNIDSFDTTIEWSMLAKQTDILENSITVLHKLPVADFSKTFIEINGNTALTASKENNNGSTTFYVKTNDTSTSHSYKLSGSMIYG